MPPQGHAFFDFAELVLKSHLWLGIGKTSKKLSISFKSFYDRASASACS